MTGVSMYRELLICSLSDGRLLCVPIGISPALEAAPPTERFQWEVMGGGRELAWHSSNLNLQLSLDALLEDPHATLLTHGPVIGDEELLTTTARLSDEPLSPRH
jgi:hypothetical protein